MSENKNFFVRRMQISDLQEVTKLFNIFGFIEPRHNNQIMINFDPEGFFIAEEFNTGKLLGICSGINLSPDLAFIGQYAVLQKYEGLGIGTALWKAAFDHIGPHRNIGLYSSAKMFHKYKNRSNFGVVPQRVCLYLTGKVDCNLLIDSIEGISVVNINENNIEKVVEYEKQICDGLDSTLLLKEGTKFDDYVNAVAVNQNNQVLGYCVVSVTNLDIPVVEPLYADNKRIAELLLRKCCELLPMTQTIGLVYCCWDTHQDSVAIANKLGFESFKNKSSPIMFTKKSFDGDMKRIFCVKSKCFYPC